MLVETGRGEKLRRSLISARYVSLPPEQWDQARYDENKKLAKAADDELLRRIAVKFRYRRREAVLAQALMVHVWWNRPPPEDFTFIAMNRKRGGYEALANDRRKHADKILKLPNHASDQEIGTAVRRMLAVRTISGKLVPRRMITLTEG